jgi:SAM-dependent methyltransferase
MVIEATGTKQDDGALRGTGLLQSPQEWDARNRELADSINDLVRRYMKPEGTKKALDVGCMAGDLTDRYGAGLNLQWYGIDPDIDGASVSQQGAILDKGFAHDLQFPVGTFDCVTFANVYEHIPPHLRQASLHDIHRVLAPWGILVGQLPNPFFPIESHSRLPFMGWLPRSVQRHYWKLTPTGWDFDKAHFFSDATMRNLEQTARHAGFGKILIRGFNYSTDAIPTSVRWAARIHARIGVLPWAWQFVFTKLPG